MTRREWADKLLNRLGAPVSANARRALVAWIQSEGSAARFNPLATTLKIPGSTDFNSVGVQNYPRAEAGIEATAVTLNFDHHGYASIVGRLRRQADPERIIDAIGASEWGTDAALLTDVLADVRRTWPELGDRLIPE